MGLNTLKLSLNTLSNASVKTTQNWPHELQLTPPNLLPLRPQLSPNSKLLFKALWPESKASISNLLLVTEAVSSTDLLESIHSHSKCDNVPPLLFHNTVPDSCLSSKRRSASSNVSTNDFTLVRHCQTTSKLSSINTDLNSKDKFKLMLLLSKLKLTLPSKKLLKATDVTHDASSEPDVSDSHKNHSHDRASKCHVHQEPPANSSVSVPSRLTGTVALTAVSELVLLRKKNAPSITKPILRLSTQKLPNTLMNLPPRLLHGKLKLKNGLKLLPALFALKLNV